MLKGYYFKSVFILNYLRLHFLKIKTIVKLNQIVKCPILD